MSNADLLMAVIKQAGTASLEAEQIAQAACRNSAVLAQELVPTLDRIVNRLQQAHSAALALQERAHGKPQPLVGE